MSTDTLTGRAASAVTDKIEEVESTLKNVEQNVREKAAQAGETASEIVDQYSHDAQVRAEATLDSVESYIREKPLQAAGMAFAAGIVTAMLLRK